jgi:hypothetical protein
MILPVLIAIAWAATFASNTRETKKAETPVELAHVSNSFQFVVHGPLSRVAPLFGPEAERSWAGKHWNPEFVYPQEAKDVQGAVFTVQHGSHKGVWVNTVFDLAGGRMQYVYFIPDVLVSTVDVKLTPLDSSSTTVDVTYVRTALVAEANDDVRSLGDRDRASGPEWQDAIEAYFKDQRK